MKRNPQARANPLRKNQFQNLDQGQDKIQELINMDVLKEVEEEEEEEEEILGNRKGNHGVITTIDKMIEIRAEIGIEVIKGSIRKNRGRIEVIKTQGEVDKMEVVEVDKILVAKIAIRRMTEMTEMTEMIEMTDTRIIRDNSKIVLKIIVIIIDTLIAIIAKIGGITLIKGRIHIKTTIINRIRTIRIREGIREVLSNTKEMIIIAKVNPNIMAETLIKNPLMIGIKMTGE